MSKPSSSSDQARALADFAFGTHTQVVDVSRPLAWLSPEELEIDLSDPVQRRFGDYELIEKIGQGGMGVVYRARQHGLERDVAVKLLAAGPWASDEFIARFRREAHSAARMQHPNIVEVHEFGHRDGLNYFSMRLIEGQSLAQRLQRKGPMPAVEAAKLLRTIAEAMDYAHRLGVLHLDLKPANVLMAANDIPLIADFGLARRIDAGHDGDSDEVSGSPSYMAPEQAMLASHPLSAATDIYGLGAVLYETLTGRPPFLGADPQSTLERVVAEQPVAPRSLRKTVPQDLEAICLKCLVKNPSDRYASAHALADDLGRFVDGRAVSVRPLNSMQRLGRWARREPRFASAIATAALALMIGMTATAVQWRRAEHALGVAREQRALAEARSQRATRLTALMASLFPAGGDGASRDRLAEEGTSVVAWLDREIPGKDQEQGEILQALAQALIKAGKPTAAESLLSPAIEQLGHTYRQSVIAQLARRNDGHSLALAALLMDADRTSGNLAPGELERLLRQAVARSPNDVDVLIIASTICSTSGAPPCAVPDAGQQLAQLDPDNAANWLLAARGVADPTRIRALLHSAAKAGHYDDHYSRKLQLYVEAYAASGLKMPAALTLPGSVISGSTSPERLIGYWQSTSMPMDPFYVFVRLCDPQQTSPSDPSLRADCLAYGEKAVRSKVSLVTLMLGSVVVRRVDPGTALALEMRDLRRRYVWVTEQNDRLNAAQEQRAIAAPMMDDIIRFGELEALQRKLDRAGVAREPAADWLPMDLNDLLLPEERKPQPAKQ